MERRGQQEIVPGGETDAAREAKADETRNKGNKVETKDFLKSRMRENRTYGSVRGCKTEPLTQTKTWVKERRSRESLLDRDFMNPVAEALMSEEEKKYLKAKEDILQAAKSFSDLSPQWQAQLSKELLEAAKVLAMHQIMQRHLE